MSVQASFAFSGITTAIINDNDGRSHKLTRNLCNLDEPFLVPLRSTPHDIQQSLNISDRSKLVNAKGKHEGAHPMNEVLEIELEILLLILRNI